MFNKIKVFLHGQAITVLLQILLIILSYSCAKKETAVSYDFNNVPDRIWIGDDFWTVPLEDWHVNSGKVNCQSQIQGATLSVLSYVLSDKKEDFNISLDMGLLNPGKNKGSSGLTIGAEASEEKDIRAAVYFGKGINMGVSTEGYAFLGQQTKPLPDRFDYNKFHLRVKGVRYKEGYNLTMRISDDSDSDLLEILIYTEDPVAGIVQMVNNFRDSKSADKGPQFWFDNIKLSGRKFRFCPEKRFGPVLWTMYTLSGNVLKMTAQLPPIGNSENGEAILQVSNGKDWVSVAKANMDPDARTVTWKLENWNPAVEKDYRVLFEYIDGKGVLQLAEYTGIICKDPVNRDLRMGALTCQYYYGFPYSPLVKNLRLSKPDILYFSGDQIYESNGGYPIKREPEDKAILSYLGKWYMFGWAFGDLMRNVPTICTPDDHDVFHGNVWGEGGALKISSGDDVAGFIQTVSMLNAVNRTQCAHLPDPYDPSPMDRGISVWYTSLTYGRISFAIVSDRYFKSGPENVATWEGRKDHLKEPLVDDTSGLDNPGLEMLGKRQEAFLEEWIYDWSNADMKVLLSQTIFANVATHHGKYDSFLYGDLDSNGWPKTARDRVLRILRKAFVFHIAGDQHLPSIVQYGIDDFRDAGWCYVTPAIAVGYSRWFRPDDMNFPVKNRPDHGYPNTGEYTDAFGNNNYVYAIGNPVNFSHTGDRYQLAHIKSSGFGMVIFNKNERKITIESWRFLANINKQGKEDQHPGWPCTIHQYDNFGKKPAAWLPKLKISGGADPVIEVRNKEKNETVYILRIKGNDFKPWVFEDGTYDVKVTYPETNTHKMIYDLNTREQGSDQELIISME